MTTASTLRAHAAHRAAAPTLRLTPDHAALDPAPPESPHATPDAHPATRHDRAPAPLPVAVTPQLLLDFLNPALTLLQVAARHRLDLQSLIDWSRDPRTLETLRRLHDAEDHRARLILRHARPDALRALVRAVAAPGLETSRRAASAVLRVPPGADAAAPAHDTPQPTSDNPTHTPDHPDSPPHATPSRAPAPTRAKPAAPPRPAPRLTPSKTPVPNAPPRATTGPIHEDSRAMPP